MFGIGALKLAIKAARRLKAQKASDDGENPGLLSKFLNTEGPELTKQPVDPTEIESEGDPCKLRKF